MVDEPVLQFLSGIETEAQLQNIPLNGTLRLWINRRVLLKETVDYTVDYQTGELLLKTPSGPNSLLTADYYYADTSLGPIQFYANQADIKTLPGVVLAFGKRSKAGDKVAIRVYPDRVDTAMAYGGKFEVTFELDVIAEDPMQMEEIADYAVMLLWAQRKSALEFEGIELIDISIGGETEETYDETGQTMYYLASLTVKFRADWEMHVPLPLTFSNVQVTATPITNSLLLTTVPVIVGRNNDYERIG